MNEFLSGIEDFSRFLSTRADDVEETKEMPRVEGSPPRAHTRAATTFATPSRPAQSKAHARTVSSVTNGGKRPGLSPFPTAAGVLSLTRCPMQLLPKPAVVAPPRA